MRYSNCPQCSNWGTTTASCLLCDANAQIMGLQAEIERLMEDLDDHNTVGQSFVTIANEKNKELATLEAEVERLREELARRHDEDKALRQIRELKRQMAQRDSELTTLRARLDVAVEHHENEIANCEDLDECDFCDERRVLIAKLKGEQDD